MIVADTGAIVALIDADDRHHHALRAQFERNSQSWVLPWAVLPEVDYLIMKHVGSASAEAFLGDLADGLYSVEWGMDTDFERAHELCVRYQSLRLGLVDGVVMAIAERLHAEAIATIDLRHFSAVELRGQPRLLPRDLDS